MAERAGWVVRRLADVLDGIVPNFGRSIGWETLLAAVSFPASILLNRSLGAEQRGLLALTLLVPTTIFTLGACQWDRTARGLVASRSISPREAWRRTIRYSLPLSSVFVPTGLLISAVYPGLPDQARVWSAIYCLNFPLYFLGGTIQSIFLAAGGLDLQYWTRLSMQGSYLLLLFLLLGLGSPNLGALIGVYFTTHLISLLVATTFSGTVLVGEEHSGRPNLRPLLQALPPLVAEAIAAKADVWAFSLFGTLTGVGQYSGLSALMIPVGLVSNALLSSSTARLDWKEPLLIRRYLLRASMALAGLCVAIGLGGMLFGPTVLSAVLGKSFAEGEWMIPWIALIVVTQAMANQFHSSVQLSGLSSAFFVIQSVDSGLRLFMVICGAWALGEFGILLALVLSSVAKIVWSAYALFVQTRNDGV